MSLDFKRLEQVLAEAAARADPTERAAYLAQACGEDRELRAEAERLLAANQQAGDFLETPVKPAPSEIAHAGATDTQAPLEPGFSTEGPGARIGRYKLLQEIGEGAFGVVYMAEQLEPVQRQVALKIIKAGMDTREVVARFEAERQALALMDHPNIAQVFDGGVTETGRPYFVMELVRGIAITDFCDQRNLATAERLQLFIQVCHAVQHAHQKGIIHRDLKPSNILVTLIDGKPVPKVIDFGVAKALGRKLTDKTLFTGFLHMVGTPAYMSPEQADLSGVDIDTRSDIYALGVLLYELLTGVTPFDAEALRNAALDEIRRLIRETEPPKPSTRISRLDEAKRTTVAKQRQAEPAALSRLVRGDLDWIVMKCLEKERGRRYETANALAQDVEHHLNLEPVSAAAPSTLYRAGKFVHRHKTGLAMATALVLLLAAGAAVSAWQAVRATRAERLQSQLRQRAEAEQERANTHARQATKEKEVARFNLYVAQIGLVQQELANGQFGLGLSLLEGQRPKEGEEDLRGFEWYYLWRQCHRGLLATLRGSGQHAQALAFSPSGTALVSADSDGTIRSCRLSGAMEQEFLGKVRTGMRCIEFSRDARLSAWGGTNGTIVVWDVGTRTESANIAAHKASILSLAFSPDSRWLASGGRDGWVRVWNAHTGEAAGPAWEHPGLSSALAFSADSKLLAASDYGTIKVYELATGRLRQTLAGHRWWIRCLAFFPDGKALVSGGNNETLKFWDLTTGQEKPAMERASNMNLEKLTLSPDGTRLALGHGDGTLEVWDLTSGQTRRYGHSGRVAALAFSPDGSRLASGSLDRTIKVWDPRAPVDLPPGKQQQKRVWRMAFSPDGKLVAWTTDLGPTTVAEVATGQVLATIYGTGLMTGFSSDGKTVASGAANGVGLWNVATWQPRAAFEGHSEWVIAVAFSPDGRSMASGSKDGTVILWDIASGRKRAVLDGHPSKWVWSLAFSPDGACLASAGGDDGGCGEGEAVLWEAASGQKRALLPGGVTCVAFSRDGETLASGMVGGSVALWDPITCRKKAEMSGHVGLAWAMAFSPDGKTLFSGNDEGSVTLWDTAHRQQRATLRTSQRLVCMLALSPDGRTLATGRMDGEVEFWRAADEREVAAQRADFEHLIELAGESSRQGVRLQERQQHADAQEAFLDAVALYESAAAQFPDRGEYGQGLILAYRRLFKLVADSHRLPAKDLTRALTLADKALGWLEAQTNNLPERASLGCDKARLLDKAHQPQVALATFTEAIKWASADTNACALILAEARLGRSALLTRMNRLDEALDDRCLALGIPPRSPQAGTNLVDLTRFYNDNWMQPRQGGVLQNNLAALPTGIQTFAGAQFDIRGLIGLPARPASVTGIPLHRKFARLHVLHGTGWDDEEATKIGAYILHYADGRQLEMPILYGEDVRNWWHWTGGKEATRATVAWTGPNPQAPARDAFLRLFKRTWDNPRPEVEVESFDFTSTGTRCAPFLIALTVE